ncbi:IclR family transcriptional regulator [Sporosarcina limicola]|uniref:DNA-binding IclR family transcriptional regulator n=1 Tax=Sporosarcina limicola TaxID=34101 RepID=A0A927R2T4_9BACL|nr:IclR family transcriptional regulator [Sporosarcina limicola]MBE1552993.1 DNA-binding IclR family transcriptional regulator [Sporosarcina limicola]
MRGSQTLERGLDILFVLTEAGRTLTVPEIAEKVSLPESTTYRFIQTLEQNGIVERKGQGQIGLGFRILDMARGLTQQIDYQLNIIAHPFMESLTNKTGETTVLAVRTGLNVVVIQRIESAHFIRMAVDEGKNLPLLEGASGKALLPFENQKVIEQTLTHLKNPKKIADLASQLNAIRGKGFVITKGEVDKDVIGIGAPIFNRFNQVIASLTIAGPSFRISKEQSELFAKELLITARKITEQLSMT